jgi:cardiolipin synthase
MAAANPRSVSGREAASWLCLGLGWLSLVAGCQTSPAELKCCDPPGHKQPSRTKVFIHQSLADSIYEATHHPIQSFQTLARVPVDRLWVTEESVVSRRLGIRLRGKPGPIPPCRPTLDPYALEEELKQLKCKDLDPACIQLFPEGPDALEALEAVIDLADCRIDVIMHEWDNDFVGAAVAQRLAARAGPNLRVRILLDGGANILYAQPKEASISYVNQVVCWLAHQPYVELIRARNAFLRLDHRKLFVIDGGRMVWSGGRNLAQHYFFEWHDLSYIMTGPLGVAMDERFEDDWKKAGGEPAAPLPAPPPPVCVNALARLVETGPKERSVAEAVYRAVDRARHHLIMENPYLSDSRLIGKLAAARRRGVDVRIVTTIHSDSKTVDRANHVIANRLLSAGVRVYLYPGMTHVKATVVDGCWAYLGTANFDRLSLARNRELGVAVGFGPVICELEERVLAPDLNPDWELTEPLPVSPCDYIWEILAGRFL